MSKTIFRVGIVILLVALAWMPAVGSQASATGAGARLAADNGDRAFPALDGVGHLAAGQAEVATERPRADPGSKEDRIDLLKWIAAGTLVVAPLAALLDGARRRVRNKPVRATESPDRRQLRLSGEDGRFPLRRVALRRHRIFGFGQDSN